MIRLLLITLFSFFTLFSFAQKKNKFSIEINYGLNGNFFVRSYREDDGHSSKNFLLKKFVGMIGGIEVKYKLTKKSGLGISYAKSINSREINYTGSFIRVGIKDWNIIHTDKFFQLYYEKDFSNKTPAFKCQIGLFYLRSNQQEVGIYDIPSGVVSFEERNYKSNRLEEGGVFIGFQYSKYIDRKFELGIKTRLYYLISTAELNNITLTPTLTYHF